jgi:hypothetical protein
MTTQEQKRLYYRDNFGLPVLKRQTEEYRIVAEMLQQRNHYAFTSLMAASKKRIRAETVNVRRIERSSTVGNK